MSVSTGTLSDTIYVSQGKWKGKIVTVTNHIPYFCVDADDSQNCEHELEIMHHQGEGDRHYCPTMFLTCRHCSGMADEPEPYECTRWGQ